MIVPIAKHQIPQSWSWTKLATIGTIINGDRGKNYPSRKHYVEQGVPFISAGNLEDGRIALESLNFIEQDKYDSLRNGKLQNGDIIYCLRGTLGKCAVYELDSLAAISSSLAILRLNNLVNTKYIFYYLRSPFGKELVKLSDNGTAQPNMSAESFKNYDVPIAPLQEQDRIVAKIEELFSSLDKGIESLKAAQQQLKIYRQSVLKWAFEGRLGRTPNTTVPQTNWQWVQIKDIGKIETGTTPSKKKPEYYSNVYPFYKPSDLEAGANVQSSMDGLSELGMKEARYVPENTILVTCIGATIGKTGLIKKGGGFNQQLNAIIPNGHHSPRFLYYQTISPHFQEQIKKRASATTLPILSKKKFELLKMVICSIEEQLKVVAKIDNQLSVCDKLEESIKQGLGQAEALRQSILKKAFEGKLIL